MNLALPDIIVILIYFIIILYVGFFLSKKIAPDTTQKKKQNSGKPIIDFLLAGRKLSLPLFIATLVATWYGNILGMGEFIYRGGIVAWICFAFPYYIAALLFSYFVASKIRKSKVKTIPEQMKKTYGKKVAWLSSFIVLVITVPAAYILMLGIMINLFTGWTLWLCIIIGALLSLAYIYTGGFRADVLTNTVQFVLMYFGFAVLLYFTFSHHGSLSVMLEKLPQSFKSPFGNYSWQYILSWFLIALQTFIDPGFHQRCAAAKSPGIAKRGIAISVLFWAIFDSMTLITGLYAKAYYMTDNPIMAYPLLSDAVLPVIWKGFFVVALLATIMSTLDSYAFISAITIGKDILKPLLKIKTNYFNKDTNSKTIIEDKTKNLIKTGLIITSLMSIILAIVLPSAVDLIYKTSSVAIPGLLAPMLISYSKSFTLQSKKVILIIIASSGVSLLSTVLKIYFAEFKIISQIEPMIPGIILSFILTLIFIRRVKK
jgi:SSS family solute:Na+ symporter